MSEMQAATQPLQGKCILVTRTREQASAFSERLRALGALPIEFPTIRIEPPQDWSQLDAALHRLYAAEQPLAYDWLILTSANGVSICMQRLRSQGLEPARLREVSPGLHVATIGPATAATLQEYGLSADLMPGEYVAEGVIAAMHEWARQKGISLSGQRILLARAAEARKVLVVELEQAGAHVDEVPAYYTRPVASDDEQGREILRRLQRHELDVLTFTSSSTVRNFVSWLNSCTQGAGLDATELLSGVRIASIGPITSQTARDLGLHVDIEAQTFTIDGLVEAINHAVSA